VGTLSTTDPDAGDSFVYSLVSGDGDADNASFRIVGATIVSAAPFNHEARQSYAVRVRSTDSGTSFVEKSLTIRVTDVDEPLAIDHIVAPADRIYRTGDTLLFTVVLTRPVTVTGKPELPLTIGSLKTKAVYQSGSDTNRLIFAHVVKAKSNDTDGVGLGSAIALPAGAKIRMESTNLPLALPAVGMPGVRVDTTSPTVRSVAVPPPGFYRAGQLLSIAVGMSEPVAVSGTPSLPLVIGKATRQAVYVGAASAGERLVFEYVIQPGENDADGISVGKAITSGGETMVTDAAGNRAVATLKPPATTRVVVDTAGPVVAAIKPPAAKTYRAGEPIDFIATFNERVVVSGTPGLPVVLGSAARIAAFAGFVKGSGDRAVIFRTAAIGGDVDVDGMALGSTLVLGEGTVRDVAGNATSELLLAVDSRKALVDAVAPTIASVGVPEYDAKKTVLTLRVTFSEAVVVTGKPTIPFFLGEESRQLTYASGSRSNTLVFRYSVKSSGDDVAAVIRIGSGLGTAGATIRDVVGNALASPGFPKGT